MTPTNPKLFGTVIGTPGSFQGKGTVAANAFDGNLATYFDGPNTGANAGGNGCWCGLDLGTARTITSIAYAPRSGFAPRMVGGVFQGSDRPDFGINAELYRITVAPALGVLTTVPVSAPTAYRYVRYLGPAGSCGDVAEVQFFGSVALVAPTPTAPPVVVTPVVIAAAVAAVLSAHRAYPTAFTRAPVAAHTYYHTYYVDGTAGSDANAGTDAAHPFKTAAAAQKLVKDGDAILFACGSTNGPFSGYLSVANVYVGMYGDASRGVPIGLAPPGGVWLVASGNNALVQFVDVRGGNANCTGIKFFGSGSRLEGVKISGCFQGFVPNKTTLVTAYRCSFSRNFINTAAEGACGIRNDGDVNLLLDSCTTNYNGWNGVDPATATMFNHGFYSDDDFGLSGVTCHNCIFAENAAWGMEGRPGGLVDDCLFVDNGIHGGGVFLGGVAPEACNNVFTGAVDKPCPTVKRGTGLGVFSLSGNFHDNLFVNSAGPVGPAIQFGQVVSNKLDVTVGTPMLANNLISGWDGYGLHFDVGRKSVSLAGNRIAVAGGNPAVDVHVAPGAIVASANTYAAGSTVRYVTGQVVPVATWLAGNKDTSAVGTVPTVTATVEGYAASVGLPASGQALLAAAEANCGPGWSDAYSAHAVNSYFREAARQ